MAYSSPKQALHFKNSKPLRAIWLSLSLATLLASANAVAGGEPAPEVAPDVNLKPYRATYRIAKDGMVAEVKRELQQVSGERWQLSDSARILFFSLKESADVQLRDRRITPLNYRYRQGPGKKRDQDIHYDWDSATARVELDDPNDPRLEGLTLQPGMPAEVLIRTGERTLVDYLVRPVEQSISRSLREQ